jgi:hypothetical protein
MDVEDSLKLVENKLDIAQCSDHENVLFTAYQLFGSVAELCETYRSSYLNVEAIT